MIYNYLESNAMYLALMVDSQSKEHTAQEIFNFIRTNVLAWIGFDCLGLQRPLTDTEFISYWVFFSCLISGYMLSKPYQTKSIESYQNFIEPKKPTNSQLCVESEFQNLSQEETDFLLILKKSAQEQKTTSRILLEEETILKELDPNISKIISKEFFKKPPLRRGRDRFWETFARECNHMGDEKSGYYGAHHLWSGRITESPLPKNNTHRIERFFEFDHRVLLKLKKE
ncbi:MAG: hypothetical protein HC836_47900 [Richelia sp. RM2_1_2]|nr:hypothetical protein [Richelia sp. RM2_1_2]